MKTLGNIYILLLVALFSACNDPYESGIVLFGNSF